MSDPFCSLCGGPYRPHGSHGDSLDHPHWATLARLVHGPQDHHSPDEPLLTGLGYVTSSKLVAPTDHTVSYKQTPNNELKEYDFQVCNGTTDRPFAFHEFCWYLLLRKIGAAQDKAGWKQVGTWLFHVLNSVSWVDTGDLMPENRYHGTIKLRQAMSLAGAGDLPYRDLRVIMADTPDVLLADPSQHLPVANDDHQIATSSLIFRDDSLIQPTTRQNDPFTKLPSEVIFEIFTSLPSKDVCNARLSSRHLAVTGYLNNLPQRFWASRFSPDREMGFVFPELLPQNTANRLLWLHAYLDCKQTLKDKSRLDFRNRGRIWRCLEGFATILEALISHHHKNQPGEVVDEVVDKTYFLGQKIGCPELPDQFEPDNRKFGARSREQHHFMLQDALLVQISVIRPDSATYISGIRTTCRADENGEQVVQEAGLIIPSNLTSICLLPGSTISSIDVYCSSSGIHGLRFSFTHSTDTQLVGDGLCSSNTVGVARLTAQSVIAGMIVGFDVYKAVSIQLVEQQVVDSSLVPPISAWNPALLDTETTQRLPPLALGPQTENQFSVNVYMPFGGENGSRLPLLRSMTAFMHGAMGFYGFLFAYSDGKEFWFGQRETLLNKGKLQSCIGQTFMINGQAGERINFFDVSRNKSGVGNRHIIDGIQVRTNFGRRYTFEALSCIVGRFSPQISLQVPSEECRIIALVGRVSSPIWAFEDLKAEKIRVEQPDKQRAHMPLESISSPPITRNMLTDIGWMISGTGSCFTIASLENLQCVHVSKGAEGRSRTSNNVTGIQLDYRHGGQSTVVGQWIEEADLFRLREAERVVEFSYWVNTDRVQGRESERFSTVTGIRLVTSSGRHFEVRPDNTRGLQDRLVRHCSTPYEYLHNITWIIGSSVDEINVTLQPTLALGDGRLCFAHSMQKYGPRHPAEGNTRIYFDFHHPESDRDEAETGKVTMSYYHNRELLFFHKIDQDGNQIPVQQMQVTVNRRNELVGIEFQYVDFSVKSYGRKDGISSMLHLDTTRNERLSHLVVHEYYRRYEGRKGIELYTTLNQKLAIGLKSHAPTSMATFPLEVGIAMPNIDVPYFFYDEVVNHGLPTLGTEEGIQGGVGMWVITRQQDGEDFNKIVIEDAGPIYLAGRG